MYTQFSFLLLSPCCFLLRIQFLCLRLTMKYFLPYTHTGHTQIIKVYEIRLNRKQNWDTEKNKQEKNRWFFFHSFHFMLLYFVCYQNQHKIPKMSTVHVVVTIFFSNKHFALQFSFWAKVKRHQFKQKQPLYFFFMSKSERVN